MHWYRRLFRGNPSVFWKTRRGERDTFRQFRGYLQNGPKLADGHPAALNVHPAGQNKPNRLGINPVLLH